MSEVRLRSKAPKSLLLHAKDFAGASPKGDLAQRLFRWAEGVARPRLVEVERLENGVLLRLGANAHVTCLLRDVLAFELRIAGQDISRDLSRAEGWGRKFQVVFSSVEFRVGDTLARDLGHALSISRDEESELRVLGTLTAELAIAKPSTAHRAVSVLLDVGAAMAGGGSTKRRGGTARASALLELGTLVRVDEGPFSTKLGRVTAHDDKGMIQVAFGAMASWFPAAAVLPALNENKRPRLGSSHARLKKSKAARRS